MNLINEILLAVLMFTAIAALIFIILSIRKITGIAEGMEKDLKELKASSIPVIENVKALTEKTDNILFRIEQRVFEVDAAAEEFKSGLTSLKDGLTKIKNDFPVKAISEFFRAFSFRVSEFFKRTI